MKEVVTHDGEVIEDMQALTATASMAVQLQKADVDQMVSTARAFPRSLKRVQSAIMNMATLDEESAEECMYALPRGGKPIKGPSVRFAEILKQAYGNCRAAARVVHVDRTELFVEAEGIFHDLETNSATTTRVRRRISDKRGKLFTDDMIIVTGNAACAIAKRNAILDGVPKPLWRRAYEAVQATITGDITTLAENRERALKALAVYGVKPEQIYQALGVEGVEDVTVDHIATLRGMYSALKNGEATVEEMFIGTVKPVSDHQKVADPLSDKEPQAAASEAVEAKSEAEASALTSGPEIENEEPSDQSPQGSDAAVDNPVAGEGSGDSPSLTAPENSADEAEQSETGAQPSETANEAHGEPSTAPVSELSDEDRAWLKMAARMLWAATGVGESQVLDRQNQGLLRDFTPETISRAARDRAKSILQKCKTVCFRERTAADVLPEVALTACCDVKDVV